MERFFDDNEIQNLKIKLEKKNETILIEQKKNEILLGEINNNVIKQILIEIIDIVKNYNHIEIIGNQLIFNLIIKKAILKNIYLKSFKNIVTKKL